MDVDLVVNRDQKELDLEVVRLRAVRAGVRIRGALELERVHLVKEEILEHEGGSDKGTDMAATPTK